MGFVISCYAAVAGLISDLVKPYRCIMWSFVSNWS